MMPPPITTTRAVSVTVERYVERDPDRRSSTPDRPPGRYGSGADPVEIRGDGGGLALPEAHRDAELLQVLVEDLPPELDPVGREERAHLRLPLRTAERADAVEDATEGARGI